MFNEEFKVTNFEIKRFNYLLKSKSYIYDVEEKGHGIEGQTDGFYGEHKDVDDKEDIFLNKNPVILENLAEEVEKLVQAQTDKSVVLRADSLAHHGLIITIMDGLRKRGIYKIIVSTVKPVN